MEIEEYRAEIDEIDKNIVRLFIERMEVSRKIAGKKKTEGLPIRDYRREAEKLSAVRALSPEKYRTYTERLFECLMACSREYQRSLNGDPAGSACPREQ